MQLVQKITPCLWFDNQAEAAAMYYTSIFKNSRIIRIAHDSDAGQEMHGRPPGSVMVVDFELDGQRFTGLNGGPVFKFTEAVSFQVSCDTQEELDDFWDKLSVGGDRAAQQCGWLKDKFGLSWQIVPAMLPDLFQDEASENSKRAMLAMMPMKKLDIEELRRAFAG